MLAWLMNMGFAGGNAAAPTFNPAWAADANKTVDPNLEPV